MCSVWLCWLLNSSDCELYCCLAVLSSKLQHIVHCYMIQEIPCLHTPRRLSLITIGKSKQADGVRFIEDPLHFISLHSFRHPLQLAVSRTLMQFPVRWAPVLQHTCI